LDEILKQPTDAGGDDDDDDPVLEPEIRVKVSRREEDHRNNAHLVDDETTTEAEAADRPATWPTATPPRSIPRRVSDVLSKRMAAAAVANAHFSRAGAPRQGATAPIFAYASPCLDPHGRRAGALRPCGAEGGRTAAGSESAAPAFRAPLVIYPAVAVY